PKLDRRGKCRVGLGLLIFGALGNRREMAQPADILHCDSWMDSTIGDTGPQNIVRELRQLIEDAPARRQRTRVRRVQEDDIAPDPPQHLRYAARERDFQPGEIIILEFVLRLVEQPTGADNGCSRLPPLRGDGVFEISFAVKVLAKRNDGSRNNWPVAHMDAAALEDLAG